MTATIAGSTGLIGSYLVEELLKDDYFDTVRILTRRPLDISHPKLEKKLVDFEDADSLLVALANTDVLFCTVGTTQKKVKGDKIAYRKVDYDIPVNLARYCKIVGCKKFILVSSVGANSKSNNFYLRLKGETEEAVKAVGLQSLHIMHPSMLLGNRKEARPGERIGQVLMKAVSFLLPAKYKPVQGRDVAKAMIAASKNNKTGAIICSYNEIMTLIL
ncbi:MAG: NAD(P)H-binding protein [Chitinophagales bacterium]|nr:NAD(P)H-binding protein [Chitinophagales bacterium]